MKKLLTVPFGLLACATLFAQTADETVMSIGERTVPRSEFVYAYHKNNTAGTLSPEAFAQRFIRQKWEAMEAESLQLDTLSAFTTQMQLLEQTLCDEVVPLSDKETSASKPMTKLAHLFIYLPQNSSPRMVQQAYERMDSVLSTVSDQQPFEECVRRCRTEHPGGLYGEWVSLLPHHTMEAVERNVRSLRTGEISRPFISPAGIHLVQVLSRKEATDESGETILTESEEEREQRYQLSELRDALLQQMLHQQQTVGQAYEEALADYFKEHKKSYRWEFPHFKGVVLHCKNKSQFKELQEKLERFPVEQWESLLAHHNERHPEKSVQYVCGLFQIGTQPAVDKVVFKQGNFHPSADYPYVDAIGKKLKKGPKEYTDIGAQVTADYEAQQADRNAVIWKKKYKVEINQEVLKTVNNQ